MSLLGTLTLGIIRFFGLTLLLFYLNKKWVDSSNEEFLSFFFRQWFRYVGLLGAIIYLSVNFGFYSLYNLLSILLFLVALNVLGTKHIRHFETYFVKRIKIGIHYLLKNIELKVPMMSWMKKNEVQGGINGNEKKNKPFFDVVLIFAVVVLTFIGRLYFFSLDEYALSNLWASDLIRVMNFDNQMWFDSEMNLSGELAFANFFSKLININLEVSLQYIAVLETLVMVISLFWVIRSLTRSLLCAPLIAGFSFAVFFGILPLNMFFLLQPKPTFLALTFTLPAMVYLFKPELLNLKNRNYFIAFVIAFLSIGLIDLFVLCILLPPFFLISFLFSQNLLSKKFWLGVLAYFLALIIIMAEYYRISIQIEKDFLGFLQANFISVNYYTYLPQLILPINRLLTIYLFGAILGILILLKFIFYDKENWNGSMVFLLYFISLTLGLLIKSPWLDSDLLLHSLTVFIPIVIGIDIAILIRLFFPLLNRFEKYKYIGAFTLMSGCLFGAAHFQKNILKERSASNSIAISVLEVYDKLINDHFPYSYAIVNDYRTQVLSLNEHFFLNYSTFLEEYPIRDSVYFMYRKDIVYLKKHPEKVIPKSVFLFMYKKGSGKYFLSENSSENPKLIKLLALLRKRGRKIELFQETDHFKVFEIINEPGSSKMSDLIF